GFNIMEVTLPNIVVDNAVWITRELKVLARPHHGKIEPCGDAIVVHVGGPCSFIQRPIMPEYRRSVMVLWEIYIQSPFDGRSLVRAVIVIHPTLFPSHRIGTKSRDLRPLIPTHRIK